jgi:hypothetical protein
MRIFSKQARLSIGDEQCLFVFWEDKLSIKEYEDPFMILSV